MATEGVYTDGRTADRHTVTLAIEPPYLTIRGDNLSTTRWKLGEIDVETTGGDHLRVLHPPTGGQVSVSNPGEFRERLVKQVGLSWDERLMQLAGSPYPMFLLVLGGMGMIATVILSVGWFAGTIAHGVPPGWLKPLGESVEQQLTTGADTCADDDANEQLERLLQGLNTTTMPMEVSVVDRSIPNAFTVPGGQIVIFDGLFSFVEDPNEFTGVLAHEVAHAIHRDPTASMIRTLGYRFFLMLTVGDGASWANQVINTSYSRDQESRADRTALQLLHDQNWTSTGLETFLERLGEERSSHWAMNFLSTHPLPDDRVRNLSEKSRQLSNPLTDEQWSSIRAICEDE